MHTHSAAEADRRHWALMGEDPLMKTRRHADTMQGLSPEQKRDTQKLRGGASLGYRFSSEEEAEAMRLAADLVSGMASVEDIPSPLARNVWSELRSEGHRELADAIRDRFFPSPAADSIRDLVREMLEK